MLNDKFSTTAKFQMTYGSLSLFYGGLESLLGPPKMVKGSLLASMASEPQNEAADVHASINTLLQRPLAGRRAQGWGRHGHARGH